MQPDIPVLARRSAFDPGRDLRYAAPLGSSIGEMIAHAVPASLNRDEFDIRVFISGEEVLPEHYDRVRPKVGTQVLIQVVPGNDGLRTLLMVVVTVAALAAGQFWAAGLSSTLGVSQAIAAVAITTSVQVAGALLVNALVPPRSDPTNRPVYSVQGTRNQLTPGGVIPLILGKVRYAPPYATKPVTEAVGNKRYATAAYCCGYAGLVARDWRIGKTPIERYKNVTLETRNLRANPGDTPDTSPLTLTPKGIAEESLSIELQTSVVPTGGPQIRTTLADCTSCSFDITAPGGIFATNEDGEMEAWTIDILFHYRLAGTTIWITAPQISITSRLTRPIVRTVRLDFPQRGRYEIKLTRITTDWDEADQSKRDTKRSGRTFWTALRSIWPEYPINVEFPIGLAAVRIQASGQLNGAPDELSAEFSSMCPDWDRVSQTWITRETNNPASLFRYVLTGPAITYPLTTSEVEALGDWHTFCVLRGLTYNRVHDYEASVLDVLLDICAAGRATPRNGGTTWGAVIDRALDTIAAHISPRNSWGFEQSRDYTIYPDAFRVPFLDETNDYLPAERIVPWPGFTGDPKVIEEIKMPGVTNPDMVYREARRRQYEIINRPDTFVVNQDFEHLVIERGDRVQFSHDVIDRAQKSARVAAAASGTVTLDDVVTMETGQTYAFWYQQPDGTSVLHSVDTVVGDTKVLRVTSAGPLPAWDTLIHFGPAARVSMACTVQSIESMDHITARLTLVAHAPQIEDLVAAEVVPAWFGRAGGVTQEPTGTPLVPIVTDVMSGHLAEGAATDAVPYPVVVLLQADPADTIPLGAFEVRHRKQGTSTWYQASAPAAAETVLVPGYAKADIVELQPRAVSINDKRSAWGATVTHIVAATDAPVPTNLVVAIERRTVSGGNPAAFLRLTADPTTRTDLKLVGRYRKDGTTTLISLRQDTTNAFSLTSDALNDGDAFVVEGANSTASGADRSDYVTAAGSPILATADGVAPNPPTYTSAALATSTGIVTHSFRQSPSGNANRVRLYRADGYGKVFADASSIATVAEAPNQTDTCTDSVDLGLFQYWLRALNVSGLGSTEVGPRSVLQARQPGNLLAAPDDMTNSAWAKLMVTAAASSAGPDGVAMTLLSETATTGSHRVGQVITFPSGTTSQRIRYAQGVKAAGRTRVRLYIYDAAASSYASVNFNIAEGTITTQATSGSVVTNPVASILRVATDVYLLTLTATVAASGADVRLYLINDSGTSSYAGDTAKGVATWAASVAPAA